MATTQDKTRRNFLKAAPAFALAGTAGVAMAKAATVADPILALYEEWKALHAYLNDRDLHLDDEAFNARGDELTALGKRIMEAQPRTSQGAAAQLELGLADDCFASGYYDKRDIIMAKNIIAFLRSQPV